MAPVEDDKEFKEEVNVQVLSDDDNNEVKETKESEAEVTGHDDKEEDDAEVQVLQSLGGPPVEDEDGENDEDDEDEDEDDDDEDNEEEEDLGTEYLVRPVGEAEDEDDASEFNPDENDLEEDIEEEDEEDQDINLSASKSETMGKRKRVVKDQNEPEDITGDDITPSKR